MTIHVKFFAVLRESAGVAEVSVQIPDQGSVEIALQHLAVQFPSIQHQLSRIATAVNRSYVTRAHQLRDGDELALLPPVSGG